ncbi:amidohydrolase family protein [Bradyrhizobium sp. BWC-3-1]|uniref:amidohydrolase family protein n=1 Tax=Bradyrhizobium sp. BWC-3-1 TaxID=3080012 RepID=UPI00293F7835|nr:amidohydrolase family protein [Bradyrhizobium sp. BWC-3-1]WOH57695.1 amidohydrolase family protein [Bradyrhizobium sp. BWC-3-1]
MDSDSDLRSVTIDAAFHLRKHNEIGSIEVGKYADFVLLDRNPRTVDPEHVLDLKVLRTYVEGEQIWECSAHQATIGREAT